VQIIKSITPWRGKNNALGRKILDKRLLCEHRRTVRKREDNQRIRKEARENIPIKYIEAS
jgi:hypothetical protein